MDEVPDPIDRGALRALAEKAAVPRPENGCVCTLHGRDVCDAYRDYARALCARADAMRDLGRSGTSVLALLDALDAAERATAETAERWRAVVVRYGTHEPGCEAHTATAAGEMDACDCGYREAMERAEASK